MPTAGMNDGELAEVSEKVGIWNLQEPLINSGSIV